MNRKKRFYIAGLIGNSPPEEYLPKFETAEAAMRKIGYEPVKPCKLHGCDANFVKKNWKDCMMTDICELIDCDGIYMLSDWKESRGARIEHAIAIEMGKEISYQRLPGKKPSYAI